VAEPAPKPKTETLRQLTRGRHHLTVVPEKYDRPQTRAECVEGVRPCPFVGCRHHLAVEVTGCGSLRFNFDPEDESRQSCSLDIADQGAHTVGEVSEAMNVTHQGVTYLEQQTLERLLRRHGAKLKKLLKEFG
jgi:hypothetical protein